MDVTVVSLELLRRLARLRVRPGPVVSLYVDLDPRTTVSERDVQSRLRSLLHAVCSESEEGLDHEQRASLRADRERFARLATYGFERDGAASLAVFASAGAGLWEELRLPVPLDDAVVVDREVHLTPLVPTLGEREEALVAFANRRRGSLYRVEDGTIEELVDLSDGGVPSRHDQGGWSQANYQRHVDELALRHLRAVAEELDRRFRRRGRPPVVLVCPEDERADFERLLSSDVSSAVVGWTSVEAHAPASAIAQAVKPLLEDHRAARERDLVERWSAERRQGRHATCGWDEVFAALREGRVDRLLYRRGAVATAYRCGSCGAPSAAPGACLVDGGPLEPVDAANLAVLRTLAAGGVPVALDDPARLGGEDVCALLRW
ncbi:MAG TPA: Vms1/Ankzf1 family peptidyl-tRNA hydrolase [Gaiellaceae bacterium]|nr:Vms1/Ankzf1 family peptidyl-tRNA hydrolase [Gaiellaceae bacterium]